MKVEIMLTVGERVGANKERRDERPESGKLDGFEPWRVRGSY
jgi:hypothetical protein